MAASPVYLDSDEFQLRFGVENTIAFFDDTGSRTVNDAALDAVLQAASRRTTSALASEYNGTLPFPVDKIPEMAIELTYEYAIALLWIRNPDYFKELGIKLKEVLANAEQMATDLRQSIKRMVDAEVATPANVGGDNSSMTVDPFFPALPRPFALGGTGDF